MPTPTYTPLATTTLSSSATSVVFGSIPSSYRDLVVFVTPLHASGTHGGRVRLNADTGSNYPYIYISGDSSAATVFSGTTTGNSGWVAQTTNSQFVCHIMDYSATDKHKIMISRFGRDANTNLFAVRWANTAAVTSVTLDLQGQSFAPGSKFSLYGIEA